MIRILIEKFISKTITSEELLQLYKSLKNRKNEITLQTYVQDYHDLNLAMIKKNVDQAYDKVINHIENKKKPVNRNLFPVWMRYAASILILLGIGFLYQQDYFSSNTHNVLIPKNELITLEIDDGKVQTIDLSQSKAVNDVNGNLIGNQKKTLLSYIKKTSTEKLVHNTIKVPYGKQLQLELSDGTMVYLNAGTTLKFPVAFLKDGKRQVYLTGEAYFDVSEDKSRPFIVNVQRLNVEVLGTKFNVNFHPEDTAINVVLVEGSVNLLTPDVPQSKEIILFPNQKGTLSHNTSKIIVSNVDVDLYTAWMKNRLVFRYISFDHILKRLERHYNVEIENTNVELGKDIFNASFDEIKIDSILSFFNDTHNIKYKIENNKVFIE
ncbi:MAG: FecR domain-containing protein [Flavobacteriaceae bacterium]|nr:FecR domain-containing protein [Flavobacteriaceae bacterium]